METGKTITDVYAEAFDRVAEIPPQYRNPEHIFWVQGGKENLWYPIVREQTVDSKWYELTEDGALIAEGAAVSGDSKVGNRTIIEKNARIYASEIGRSCLVGADAEIENSELGNGINVNSLATIHNSDIENGTTVGQATEIKSSKVGEENTIGERSHLKGVKTSSQVKIGRAVQAEGVDIQSHVHIEDRVKISSDIYYAEIGSGARILERTIIKGRRPHIKAMAALPCNRRRACKAWAY
jgi:carbonic anhydrase/acetyltransferase-like protein (isoleucine patch superfamily)